MSEVKPAAEGLRIYEEGIEAGSLSSLARQYRDGLVNLNVGNVQPGQTVALLQGSRWITDREARLDTEPGAGIDGRPESDRRTKVLEKLRAKYGLASRAMSLVAVVKRQGDKPGDVPKTMVVPVGMPQDTEFGAYFGTARIRERGPVYAMPASHLLAFRMQPAARHIQPSFYETPREEPRADLLMQLAAQMEPDGGMAGKDGEER